MHASISVDDNKVCVVGGYFAWSFYQRTGAYVCQQNRYFQPDAGRLGFYSKRTIFGAAPKILQVFPEVPIDDREAAQRAFSLDPVTRSVGLVIAAALEDSDTDRSVSQVVLLSRFDDPQTATFPPVHHAGRGAWTQNQSYARLDALMSSTTTDELTAFGVVDETDRPIGQE